MPRPCGNNREAFLPPEQTLRAMATARTSLVCLPYVVPKVCELMPKKLDSLLFPV